MPEDFPTKEKINEIIKQIPSAHQPRLQACSHNSGGSEKTDQFVRTTAT